jgi:hypothetical protein
VTIVTVLGDLWQQVAYTVQVLVVRWLPSQAQSLLAFMAILFHMVALILNGLFSKKVLPLQRPQLVALGTLQPT